MMKAFGEEKLVNIRIRNERLMLNEIPLDRNAPSCSLIDFLFKLITVIFLSSTTFN